MRKLSIIVPCYNESSTIREILMRLIGVPIFGWEKEIIVVDDGSTDGTKKILEEFRAKGIRVIYQPENKGKGAAVKRGLSEATGNYVLIQDADLEYNPEDIGKLIRAVEDDKSVVLGSRYLSSERKIGSYVAYVGALCITKMLNLMYGLKLTDSWTCYKLFPKALSEDFGQGKFESEILFLSAIAKKNISIKEVPIGYSPRTSKEGKKIKYRDGIKTLFSLLVDFIKNKRKNGKNLNPTYRLRRNIFLLFFFSVVLHISAFFVFYGISNINDLRFPHLTGDSLHYRTLAENLLFQGSFSTSPETFLKESFRTPGYPVFLAAIHAFTNNWILTVFIQVLIVSILPTAVFLIGQYLFNERVGFFAGVLSVLDPAWLFHSSLTLSDTLFVVLLVFSVLLFIKLDLFKNPLQITFISGLVLGYGALVRPVGQFTPFLFMVFLLIQAIQKKISYEKFIKTFLVFLFGFLLISGPWMLRNKIEFGSWQLSSVGYHNAVHYNIPLFLSQKTGEASADIQRNYKTEFESRGYMMGSLESVPLYKGVIREIIWENPFEYAIFHSVKTLPFFFTDGLRDILRLLQLGDDEIPNLTGMILRGEYSAFIKTVFGGGTNSYILLIGSGLMFTLFSFSVVGVIRGLNGPYRNEIIMLALIILYFAFATGPVANARLRLPAMPFILILSMGGLDFLIQNYKRFSRA